jgi:hypothetical protein
VKLHPTDNAVEVQMPPSIAEQSITEGDKDWFVKVIRAVLEEG